MTPRRIRRHLAQKGDRVEVTEGPLAGRKGDVVGIHLAPDGGLREAAVLLDAAGGVGAQLHRLADGLLRVLDHPAHPATEESK